MSRLVYLDNYGNTVIRGLYTNFKLQEAIRLGLVLVKVITDCRRGV